MFTWEASGFDLSPLASTRTRKRLAPSGSVTRADHVVKSSDKMASVPLTLTRATLPAVVAAEPLTVIASAAVTDFAVGNSIVADSPASDRGGGAAVPASSSPHPRSGQRSVPASESSVLGA